MYFINPKLISALREHNTIDFGSPVQKNVYTVAKDMMDSLGWTVANRLDTPRCFRSYDLRKVEPGHCTFLCDGLHFMHNNRIGHSNSTGLRSCRNTCNIHPF